MPTAIVLMPQEMVVQNGETLLLPFRVNPSTYQVTVENLCLDAFLSFPSLRAEGEAIQKTRLKECRWLKSEYKPTLEKNGETLGQIMARSKHIMPRHRFKWSTEQTERAEILFRNFPQLETAYGLSMQLTEIYNQRIAPDVARLKLAGWHNEIGEFDRILLPLASYETFVFRPCEGFSRSNLVVSRSQFRGVTDILFFLYRLSMLCA